MADLNSHFSSSPLLEPDDISVLVHTLLHSSNLPTSSPLESSELLHNQQCPPAPHVRRQFCGTAFSDAANGSEHFFHSAFSGAILSSAEGIDEFECQNEDKDASEGPWKSRQSRSSSKRTRPAEIHNLSEKRRRQRINEKMKALQKLIPNSNKTDRASMLDDAIEYLKQLQLQVQILALRNGSALHPNYIQGASHFSQPNNLGICFNVVDGLPSSSVGRSSQSTEWKIPRKAVLDPASSTFASSDQKIILPVARETGNSEHVFSDAF